MNIPLESIQVIKDDIRRLKTYRQIHAHTELILPYSKQLLTMGAGQIKLTQTSGGKGMKRGREEGEEEEEEGETERRRKKKDCRLFQRQSVS